MRLLGDLGGTKALLGLADPATRAYLAVERLHCADYADFPALLEDFFSATGLPARDVTGGCLAVAGPLEDDGRRARMTNLPWLIDADRLSRDFGIGPLTLVNDFVAAAMGVTQTSAQQRVVLQPGEPLDEGVRVVLGAGTGLGTATLTHEAGTWRVLAGEGGHTGFAPADERQAGLWARLRALHGRAENEHVLSGAGLLEVYRYVAGNKADPAVLGAPNPDAAISAAAMATPAAVQADSAPYQAMDMFLSVYGAFAGDMALAMMARGGVFLAGGISAAIVPLLQQGTFLRAFNNKGTHSALARRMPVQVVTDAELGLKGAMLLDAPPRG
jgi:glucokinase